MEGYNHMDWILHNTRGHTPAGYRWCSPNESPLGLDIKWCKTDTRHDAEGMTQEIEANTNLVKFAPLLREEVKRLRKRSKKLENALLTLANEAGDVPIFNKGGEAYEALWGEDE